MSTLSAPSSAATTSDTRRGDWIGLALAAVIWGYYSVLWAMDAQTFAAWLSMMGVNLLVALVFMIWWLRRRAFSRSQRLGAILTTLLLGVVVGVIGANGIVPLLMQFGLPIVLTLGAVWLLATSGQAARFRMIGLLACCAIGWGAFLLVRVNGTHGNMRADVHWRWTPTAEQMYLADRSAQRLPATQPSAGRVLLRPGDWPGFRGPGRDGVVRGLKIGLDWEKSPPAVLWRKRIGPAWSSMAVVDGRIYTQEQHGQNEAVVCRDAQSGSEIWVHERPVRFEEAMSGPGPRATPTFAGGRIYAQSALGALDCLDAATGRVIWTRDIRADSSAALPMWGFSGSPLVAGDRVIVFAGGEGKKGLLAYPLDGGAPIWTADAGKVSYASPQEFGIGSQRGVLMFTNEGLFAADRKSGRILWQFPVTAGVGVPSALQACPIAPDSLVLGNGVAFGLERIRVAEGAQPPTRVWAMHRVNPSFSDMVYHDGYLYGFDGTVFCCVDAASGARRWREGRYGAGQVVLLADQGVMIVASEFGQAILLRCNPEKNEELGSVQAISGKAWNHPAIAGGRLYVRSDAEMACLQLQVISKP